MATKKWNQLNSGEKVGTVLAYILMGMVAVVIVGAFIKYVIIGWLFA